MEPLAPPAFNPHLKRVLKSYQSSALKSLNGPSNYVQGWGDPTKLRPGDMKALLALEAMKRQTGGVDIDNNPSSKVDIPLISPPVPSNNPSQMPLFLPMDSTRSEKTDTYLEGEAIACFVVGGEKRLCLPQILNTVLREFSLQQINNICDELHIFCSRCNGEQLEILKMTRVLPASAPSCGLITKTDAERLCNALLHSAPEKSREPPSPNAFKVYHECFGICKGLLSPELYNSEIAKCIECFDCRGLFSPQKFVVHSHKKLENRTCHWGFDSANWRSYLLLAKDQDNRGRCQMILEEFKAKYDYTNRYKRKESPDEGKDESKRARYNEDAGPGKVYEWTDGGFPRQVSAFRPWSPSSSMAQAIKEGKVPNLAAINAHYREGISRSLPPYLQTGPPVLLNPERVIPHNENTRYERHFAPNVSLAPASQQKVIKSEKEEEQEAPEVRPTQQPEEEDILDIDSSSSDFDSSMKSSEDSSVPSTPGPDVASGLMSPRHHNDVDVKPTPADSGKPRELRASSVTMLRRAMDGEVSKDAEEREAFLQQFVKLQICQEEKIIYLEKTNHQLRMELERSRAAQSEQMKEMNASRRALGEEVEALRRDMETKIRQAEDRTTHLQAELDKARRRPNHNVSEIVGHLAAIEARMTEEQVDVDVRRNLEEQRRMVVKLLGEESAGPMPKSEGQDAGGGGEEQRAKNSIPDTGGRIKKERMDDTTAA